jgi:hypothetical protein
MELESPSGAQRERDIERGRTDANEEWKSCCGVHSDSHFVKYLAQLAICFTVLIFCVVMVIINNGKNSEVYFSLISGIVGLYSPTPTVKR